ncbi:MAG: CHAT domain-containing protein [Candidatus Krumholzibacteria bacterium]|nr:CHAT domain-containing protein [Candidatus Krumholzibacteria bacterium]
MESGADSLTVALADSLRLVQYRLSNLILEGPGEELQSYLRETDSLELEAVALEKELIVRSERYRKQKEYREISCSTVSSLLPEGSILLEYVEYTRYELAPDTSVSCMAVLVLDKDTDPMLVDLGDTGRLNIFVDQYHDHLLNLARSGAAPTSRDVRWYRSISERLTRFALEPIKSLIRDKDLLIIAPDGALGLISFSGLMEGDGRYFIERHAIHYLSSGRDIVRYADRPFSASGLFALGDPDFDADASSRLSSLMIPRDTPLSSPENKMLALRWSGSSIEGLSLSPLPGTRREIALIVQRWKETSREPAIECLGPGASEEQLKAAIHGHRIVHLATHGFSFKTPYQHALSGYSSRSGTAVAIDNPLLRSGLFLAGANLVGRGAGIESAAEDGVLTAYEVSALSLDGTDLVVLSACETGMGAVETGEGVYGLKRAFQMAGARIVISSLWRVLDTDTADMMANLYRNRSESIPETMRRIQNGKIEELRAGDLTDHPFHWAAFIVTGDWK